MKYEIGQVILKDEPVIINKDKEAIEITVRNTGDRSIQVCSHYHFFEANPALKFDREKAFGRRLDVPSGTAVRFDPGEDKTVSLIPYGGEQKIYGFRGWTMGDSKDEAVKAAALEAEKAELKTGGEK